MPKRPKLNRQQGFTVIELVVVLLIIVILSAIIIAGYSGIKAKERNVERKNDIDLLQSQFEYYYAKTNRYPSLSQANSVSWDTKNLREFNKEILRDPLVRSYELAPAPEAQKYAYNVLTADGQPCDNNQKTCTQYTLTATYEGGNTYTRTSRN